MTGLGQRIFQDNGIFDMLSMKQMQDCTAATGWDNDKGEYFCFPPPNRGWIELYLSRTLKFAILCFARQDRFVHPYTAAINLHRSVFLAKMKAHQFMEESQLKL